MTKAEEQKVKELEQLNSFMQTPIGFKWYQDCFITDNKQGESPDFILKTKLDKVIGIEITEFIVANKNTKYTQVLTTIGNQVCQYSKKRYNLDVSILINQHDKLLWSSKWSDHLKRAYDPGFSYVPSPKEFKEKLQEFVDVNIEKLKEKTFVQDWITHHNEYFQITIETFPSISSGKFDCHVNNAGCCKEDPIENLQACIDEKNNKFENYIKKCDECYLLVILQDSSKGSFCFYTDALLKHKYTSKFKEIFFYDEKKKQAYKLCAQ